MDLYFSYTTYANENNFDLKSNGLGDDKLSVYLPTAGANYITVWAKSNTAYQLDATFTAAEVINY